MTGIPVPPALLRGDVSPDSLEDRLSLLLREQVALEDSAVCCVFTPFTNEDTSCRLVPHTTLCPGPVCDIPQVEARTMASISVYSKNGSMVFNHSKQYFSYYIVVEHRT